MPSTGSASAPGTSVVLVNFDLVDTLGVVDLPSIPFGPSLFGALRLSFRFVPEPCGAAAGNPGPAPSTRCSAALGQTAQTHPGRSTPVGLAVRPVERLAVQCLSRPTGDGERLASEGLSPLLDREDSRGKARKARGTEGNPRFDSQDEPRESALGRSPD